MKLEKPYLDKRFEKIIIMCQEAREKYGFDYEVKYNKKIDKFVDEIVRDNLLDNCDGRNFAEQLCMANGLARAITI